MEDKKIIKEGKCQFRLCSKEFKAFYNPSQMVNRDLTVLILRTVFGEERIRIIDCTAAAGIRAIRFRKELNSEVTAVDYDKNVISIISDNKEFNEIEDSFIILRENCVSTLYRNLRAFDCIEIDPYGSPSQMLDAAVAASSKSAVLAVSFTDMTVLCGNSPETGFYKYDCIIRKVPSCHEVAMRVAIATLSRAANKHKRAIIPLFSYNAEFYLRIFVKIVDSAEECKLSAAKMGRVSL